MNIIDMGKAARKAAAALAALSATDKNLLLHAMADALVANSDSILNANAQDVALTRLKGPMVDRLTLTSKRVEEIAAGVRAVAALDDPVGEMVSMAERPNGLIIGKRRVPMGVIAVIYEARPNVTSDCAALCIKSGNACILRGGSEAIRSNSAIASIMRDAIGAAGFNPDALQLVEDTSRESAAELMRLNEYVDLLIPRGGRSLIESAVKNATVPVIETGLGNCHVYIDHPCDEEMGVDIIVNAKTSRPSVCNAAETLLVHAAAAKSFLPKAAAALTAHGVEIRGCLRTQEIISCTPASETDWSTEYDDLILAVKIVDSSDEAIEHINLYNTRHSEAIVTKSYENAQKFLRLVDAAAVYVNASTRFTDGGEFGMGAEIGISTQKMHARGPMGLRELTSTKYIIYGNGQVR
ncbi:MAG: glutamate-5-semialdehyde dehydrogenase [Clostridia bacterium]|nr:glutamate-5-semialdehyde dehydrogenase [Clostridia bacterium]